MGYIRTIYYLYLLTHLLLPFPVGYPSYYPMGIWVINCPDTAALFPAELGDVKITNLLKI